MVKQITIKSLCIAISMPFVAMSGRAPAAANQPTNLPNIVFVFADDMGWGDARCYNPESKIPTPNVDRLATEGMRFTDAHSAGSTCAPSRFGLMTGRSPVFWKYYDVMGDAWNCLTMPGMLQEAGYHTSAIGKWHFTAQFEGLDGKICRPRGKRVSGKPDVSKPCSYGPIHHGFDYFFGTLSQPANGMLCNMENRMLIGNPKFIKGRFVSASFDINRWFKLTTEKTVSQIEELASKGRDRPFFVYYAMNAPHTPLIPNKEFIGRSDAGEYGDYCTQVDWSLGEIDQAIREAGIADNTILIFSSDNGSVAPRRICKTVYPGKYDTSKAPLNGHSANAHWRGIKADVWEGGHRVPYIVRWPGRVKPGSVCEQTVSLMDHMATFAEIAGYRLRKEDGVDSRSMLPFWLGHGNEEPSKRTLVHYSNSATSLRYHQWKIIPRNLGSGGFSDPRFLAPGKGDPQGQLYNLDQDPGEQKNVWNEHPEVVKMLTEVLNKSQEAKRTVDIDVEMCR